MRRSAQEFAKALKNAVFEIKDNNTYDYYYYKPGIPRRIETVRETIIDIDNQQGKRIDKMIIELLECN